MATAQLNEKRVDRPYLYPAPTAGVSNLSGLNVVFSIRMQERQGGQPLDELVAGLGSSESLQ